MALFGLEHSADADKWEVDQVEVDEDDGGYLADKKKQALQPQFGLYVPGKPQASSTTAVPPGKPLGPRDDVLKLRASYLQEKEQEAKAAMAAAKKRPRTEQLSEAEKARRLDEFKQDAAAREIESEQRMRAHQAAIAEAEREAEEALLRGGKLDNVAAKVDAATMEQRVRGNRFYAQRDASDPSSFMKR